MSNRSREGYTFGHELKEERIRGVEGHCEACGRFSRQLQIHHLIGCYFAARNPTLIPGIVRTIENAQALCPTCHQKADADHKHWTEHDVAMLAWSLFDLDPEEVEANQNGTYLNGTSLGGERRKKSKSKHKHRRRKSRKSRRY